MQQNSLCGKENSHHHSNMPHSASPTWGTAAQTAASWQQQQQLPAAFQHYHHQAIAGSPSGFRGLQQLNSITTNNNCQIAIQQQQHSSCCSWGSNRLFNFSRTAAGGLDARRWQQAGGRKVKLWRKRRGVSLSTDKSWSTIPNNHPRYISFQVSSYV